RRRHTRCYRDWSSDVCSSDLILVIGLGGAVERRLEKHLVHVELDVGAEQVENDPDDLRMVGILLEDRIVARDVPELADAILHGKIGRASCRGREWSQGGGGGG